MKLFYSLAGIVSIAMVLSPFYFLHGTAAKPIEKVIASYDANDKPQFRGQTKDCYYKEPLQIYYGNGGTIKNLDPAICGDASSGAILWNIYEGLYGYKYLEFEGGNPNPKKGEKIDLAKQPILTSVLADGLPEVSADGKVYTIKIKRGVYFDRNPCFGKSKLNPKVYANREVEAKDFVLGFLRIADGHQTQSRLAFSFIASQIKGVANYHKTTKTEFEKGDFSRYDLDSKLVKSVGVKAIGKYKLQITLNKRNSLFKYIIALNNYAPIPREAVDFWLGSKSKDDDNPNSLDREPMPANQQEVYFSQYYMVVGTGAYKFRNYEEKIRIELIRNPSFARRKYAYPNLANISEQFYPKKFAKYLIQEKIFTPDQLKKFKRGVPRYYDYTADSDYAERCIAHNKKNPGSRKYPYLPFIDVYIFEEVQEVNTMWSRFLTGRTDTGPIPKETMQEVLSPEKGLTDKWKKRHIYLRRGSKPTVYWLTLNQKNKYFKNSKSLRQAMSLCFDVHTYLKLFAGGNGEPVFTCMPSTFKIANLAGPSKYYYKKYSANYEENEKVMEKAVAEAKKLMKKARQELINAKVINEGDKWPKCLPEFGYLTGTTGSAAQQTTYLEQQFAKIDVKIKGIPCDGSIIMQKHASGEFDITFSGWGADYFDAENFLQLYYGPNIKKGYNQSRWQNDEFDKMFELARDLPDGKEKDDLYVKMTRMISDECPVIMIFQPVVMGLNYEWYLNVILHPFNNGTLKYRKIDVKLKKELGGRN